MVSFVTGAIEAKDGLHSGHLFLRIFADNQNIVRRSLRHKRATLFRR